MRILIVEDEQHLAIGLRYNFEQEGYAVDVASDGPTAISLLQQHDYALIILDLMLPGMSGYEVCEQIRSRDTDVPVLVLSARTLSEDKTRAFDCGTDQYMTKPFDLPELLSRVRNLLERRSRGGNNQENVYTFADAVVDFRKHEVTVGGEQRSLTALQFKLLQLFVRNEGAVLSRAEILERVWGITSAPSTRTVDMAVMALRKAFEADPGAPKHFRSIRGAGYRFDPNPEDISP